MTISIVMLHETIMHQSIEFLSFVNKGTDVFKALALGAKAVFIGRPVLYGLTVDGQKGVEDLLNILKNELNNAMALAGINKISEINEKYVADETVFRLSKL